MGWIILLIAVGLAIYFLRSKENNQGQINNHNHTAQKRPAKTSKENRVNSQDVEFGNKVLRVSDNNFYGPYNRSENKKYTVGCDDSDYKADFGETKRGGFRKDGMGRAILLEKEKVIWSKEFERPHDAEVSDKGYVALNDWLFGEGLKGNFFILNPDGNILIEDKLSANLQDLGITSDSRLAWTTTAASDNSYSNQLFVYDITQRKRLFKRDRLYGQIVTTAMKETFIEFITNQNIHYKFDLTGKLLNEDEVIQQVEDQKLNSNDLWAVHSVVEEKIAAFESDGFDKNEVVKIIQKLDDLDLKTKDKYMAKTFRYKGELKLLLKRKEDALLDFENALKIDSKVGIKRKASKLRKELS